MSGAPISFSFDPTVEGGHAHVVVRCGTEGARALCGSLTMRTDEWYLLRWVLATTPPLEPDDEYVPDWVKVYATRSGALIAAGEAPPEDQTP